MFLRSPLNQLYVPRAWNLLQTRCAQNPIFCNGKIARARDLYFFPHFFLHKLKNSWTILIWCKTIKKYYEWTYFTLYFNFNIERIFFFERISNLRWVEYAWLHRIKKKLGVKVIPFNGLGGHGVQFVSSGFFFEIKHKNLLGFGWVKSGPINLLLANMGEGFVYPLLGRGNKIALKFWTGGSKQSKLSLDHTLEK